MTTRSGVSRVLALVLVVAIAGGSFLAVSPRSRAPYFGMVLENGQYAINYATPGLTRCPNQFACNLYVPTETIRVTVLATAGEIYDGFMVVRNPDPLVPRDQWQVIGLPQNNRAVPTNGQLTMTFVVPANLADGDSYEIEIGDQNYVENSRTTGFLDSRAFAVQEYIFLVEVNRTRPFVGLGAYIGGDTVTITWSANKMIDGSLAAPGSGQIWVHNTNRENLQNPNPHLFPDPSGSYSFAIPDLTSPNYDGVVEAWFNNSGASVVRFQWTCAGLRASTPVEQFCGSAFTIDLLGVIVSAGSATYAPQDIVTVDVRTVVTNDQQFPSGPPEPFMFVSIAVWDITAAPVNKTQYAAAGLRTDAHGDLRYVFQLDAGIADKTQFEVRANASHPNTLWNDGDEAQFEVRLAATLTLNLKFDRPAYQAGDAITVQAIAEGAGTLTYKFEVRDSPFSICPGGSILATSTGTSATYTYTVDQNFAGLLCFYVTVSDNQGNWIPRFQLVNIQWGWLLINSNQQEYSAGTPITISWELVSNRLDKTRATYFYEVEDATGAVVATGTRAAGVTNFRFDVPSPPSSEYTFRVTATESGRIVANQITLFEVAGFFVTVTFDRSSYSPGDTVRAHYTISQRSASSVLPNTFALTYGLFNAPQRTTSTSAKTGDLVYVIPRGIDEGDELFFLSVNGGSTVIEVLTIRGTNPLWFASLGDIPTIVLILLVWLVVITLLLWRKGVFTGGGGLMSRAPSPPETVQAPPAPSEPVYAPPTSPMTVTCRSCGAPIEITTSKRPIEVMCPRCGNTEMVA